MSLLSRLNKDPNEKPNDQSKVKQGQKKDAKTQQVKTSPTDKKEKKFLELKNRLHKALIGEVDPELLDKSVKGDDVDKSELEKEVKEKIDKLLESEGADLPRPDKNKLASEILNETLGFGPIDPLLREESISEIMVNGPKQVYIEKDGKLELTEIAFKDDEHVRHVIEKIVAPLGRRIDESSPMVDARLPDGSRVNAIIPPLAINGSTLTIRKFKQDTLTVEKLVGYGTITTEMARFLKACVSARLNILVSGGTGSGKTSTLNVLSSFIPPGERIVTIEDAAELKLEQDHIITLEARPPNLEGKGAITIRDLVKNSLRMRPDRIVVGEVRSGEALDMLQAMNTGHDGSITTGHANSPRDMLSRLETMVLMAGMDLPIKAIREQIAAAIDLVVQQARFRDGTRKITKISEVSGMEGDVITMQDIFVYEEQGKDEQGKIKGEFKNTGIRPGFYNYLVQAGYNPEL